MGEAFLYLALSFWNGAVHAATPGHGKTIAAAYIVGVRGRPADAWILGVFVTLSHTSGLVLAGVLVALGLPGMVPHRIEAWMALATGLLVIGIGLWSIWTQRRLISIALSQDRMDAPHDAGAPVSYRAVAHDHGDGAAYVAGHTHAHGHGHDHARGADHVHGHEEAGFHTHGWGFRHTHDMSLITTRRPSLWVLLGLGIAGGLVPDPVTLGILVGLLPQGKVMLGLAIVLTFSLGFASVLVLVALVAAKVGPKILDWLSGRWAVRLQVATSVLIVAVGIMLSVNAWRLLSRLA